MLFIDDLDIKGQKLLIRVEFNVPMDHGDITDDNRIRASLPTINYALDKGAALILCSHLGKPKGEVIPELSLAPVARHLSGLLGRKVILASDCIGAEVEAMVANVNPGQVLLLENLRFHAEEQGKTSELRGDFGRKLAGLADVYVNDAFGVAHRENASVVDIPKYSKKCCGGLLLKREWNYLNKAVRDPERPYTAISGGAKVSTKIGIIDNLLGKVDDFIIGGAMANTFSLAMGNGVGKSLVESELVETAREIIKRADDTGSRLHLPVDCVLGKSINDNISLGICPIDKVPNDAMILDVGPETVKNFSAVLGKSRTVVWNGPMGLFENPAFAEGSLGVCRAMAGLEDAVTIVGGGDTDAVVHLTDLSEKFSFISTGGGSFLEFLEGKELPGFKALKECMNK